MDSAISFANGSQILALNSCDRLCYVIQPFIQEILNQFVQLNSLDQAIVIGAKKHHKIAEKLFEFELDNPAETFSLKEQFLFPEKSPILSLQYGNTRYPLFLEKYGSEIIYDQSTLPAIHKLFYLCGQSNLSYEQICGQLEQPMIDFLDKLIDTKVVQNKPNQPKSLELKTPGVFRLQHAALLYRTKTTGILVDPHLHSNYGIPNLKKDISRAMLGDNVDAILISHPHYDHWHYPTLMMFPPEIPIIAPKVPRGSIMCEDMKARLESLGFTNVMAVDWYAEPILVGDIEINVLPFYGEQPLVPEFNQPKHPDLRNWGNTYLINTEYYKSWFLIDSGDDDMGTMAEVAEYVKEKFGTLDHVLSNFQPLSYNSIGTDLSGWGIDIVANLLSNPQIFSVTNKKEGEHIALLGPQGVAKICSIVGAKYCLPYADSWAELGESGIHDATLIKDVKEELHNLDCLTQVIPWKIGDQFVINGTSKIEENIFINL
ncbi:MBL fold metallo-hydrolase [Cyanobacterium aponinum]|uniref:Metallo-beta-lactamase domain-containing protein n=1 Tax=Cyanobacterium aponinum 0216 TaxID=2676140 RepID=A0A844GYR1_9CHRO|nr:MBL fold metallo-hydrolase [Cyanobacterium aponinum]MTF40713.1 hypothetical protein [Cyanobacterium aponinum 0216]